MCLSNSITLPPIVPESCSNPQKTLQVLESTIKKILGFVLFASDAISEEGFRHFGSCYLA